MNTFDDRFLFYDERTQCYILIVSRNGLILRLHVYSEGGN